MDTKREVATLGGGCFWCLEAVFDDLKGVESVESGLHGRQRERTRRTSRCAAAIPVTPKSCSSTFDPAVVSFEDILEVFFVIHDPTTLNRQGNDAGTQYRSAIFYHSPEQKAAAERVIADITREKLYRDPIVTEVAPASTFYVAEGYHQEYLRAQSLPAVLPVRGRAEGRQVPQALHRAAEEESQRRLRS